jgi:aspartate/methionine/tyrosine aminotransferase
LTTPAFFRYLWFKLPVEDDLNFCMELLHHTGVALSPGQNFGPGGKGHARIALVQPEEQLKEAARRIGVFLKEREQRRLQNSAMSQL